MSDTSYFDVYMRGERSTFYQHKKFLESMRNDYQYNFFQNIIGTYSEDLEYDD